MTWLAWRQFRASVATAAAALAVLAVILAVTGPGLAHDYSRGIAACTGHSGGCSNFVREFFRQHRGAFVGVTIATLALPALLGLFWGAPLIARELEAGTHRLVWTQSVTRVRWLAAKLGLAGLGVVAVAGLATLAVTVWSRPIDKTALDDPRMSPIVFAARGIVPIGYAAFAFALGVTVGMLVRRTLPAMAITLAVFVAVQLAMPRLVRAHLIPPVRADVTITASNLEMFAARAPDGPVRVSARASDPGAWVLSSHTVDKSGHSVDTIPLSLAATECAPSKRGLAPSCFAKIARLGYRQRVTYQPASRFWALQAYETAIFVGLALLLSGFSFWWLRRRLS